MNKTLIVQALAMGNPYIQTDRRHTENNFYVFKGAEIVQIRQNIELDISHNRNTSRTYCADEKVTNENAEGAIYGNKAMRIGTSGAGAITKHPAQKVIHAHFKCR
jgi:hypothetical protein